MKLKEAAKLNIPELQKAVLMYFLEAPARTKGATCEEVEKACGLRHQTASPRIRELVQSGFLEITKLRRTNDSGRTARVYKVVK